MISNSLLYEVGLGKQPFDETKVYDVFIAPFNLSERVDDTFTRVAATRKCWLIHNEYYLSDAELPEDFQLLRSNQSSEAEFLTDCFSQIQPQLAPQCSLCIDITGFMRPHLMFLMHYLYTLQFESVDLIYTEPAQYERKADTVFSSDIKEVRQVNGYEGTHGIDMSKDILLVGVGYDHDLISHVIAHRSSAKLVQLLGLPSLSADMYQESLIRLHRVSDAPPVRVPDEQLAYSSANDPYITYIVLHEALERIKSHQGSITNVYFSPLATKPQVVGFAMYYLNHLIRSPASIIFPFARKYSKETSVGVGRCWKYSFNFRAMQRA